MAKEIRIMFYGVGTDQRVRVTFSPKLTEDLIMDGLQRACAAFFRQYVDRMEESYDGSDKEEYINYLKSTAINRFAEVVKARAGFIDKTLDDLVAEYYRKGFEP